MDAIIPPKPTLKENTVPAWRVGLKAAKANLLPGLVVQGLMLTLILSYYSSPVVQIGLDRLGQVKSTWGLAFVLLASALSGAIFPEILKILLLQKARVTQENTKNIVFLVPYWMLLGACVDLFYQGQEMLFGNHTDWLTVATKVAVDPFLYTPFFACPLAVILVELRRLKWNLNAIGGMLNRNFYQFRIFPLVIAAWGVWIPLVSVVYAMPTALQFPVFSLILSFWSLMQSMIASGPPEP